MPRPTKSRDSTRFLSAPTGGHTAAADVGTVAATWLTAAPTACTATRANARAVANEDVAPVRQLAAPEPTPVHRINATEITAVDALAAS